MYSRCLSLTNLVCVLFDPAIPTSSFNFIVFILVCKYCHEHMSSHRRRRSIQLPHTLRSHQNTKSSVIHSKYGKCESIGTGYCHIHTWIATPSSAFEWTICRKTILNNAHARQGYCASSSWSTHFYMTCTLFEAPKSDIEGYRKGFKVS